MSIAKFVPSANNQGVWEYKNFDGETVCYTVRTIEEGKKAIKPWTFDGNRWINKGLSYKPIYNLHLLQEFPDKPILIVEGEKTADAGSLIFPQFNVITWLGGCNEVKKPDYSLLRGKVIYLLPDNDKVGYEAMEWLRDNLPAKIHCVDVKKLGVEEHWDLADLGNDKGVVEAVQVIDFVFSAKEIERNFDVKNYPELGGSERKPRPLDTSRNLKYLSDFYFIKVRWNMMRRMREIIVPGVKFYKEEEENASLMYIRNLAENHFFKLTNVDKHLDYLAFNDVYHPMRNWVLSKSLSNKNILEDFLNVLKTTNDTLSKLLLKRWMVSAIAVLFNEGDFVAQGVLVLQGKGGWRKTSFISSLVPKDFQAIKTGSELDPSSKDILIRLARYWIAELGELGGTFKKSEINKLKSHITESIDEARRPYAFKDSHMVRRTVYAATVNEENFLVDETGNRRWWVVSLTEEINTDHGLDMQQVWRAVYELYLVGERAYLDNEELSLLNDSNEQYESIDPFEEKLEIFFDWEIPNYNWMSPTEILMHIGYENTSRSDTTRMGGILTKRKLRNKRNNKHKVYLMPKFKYKKV